MNILYPSLEFDAAVASVCHGDLSEENAAALQALLQSNQQALDEYILRIELHACLSASPEFFFTRRRSQGNCLIEPPSDTTSSLFKFSSNWRVVIPWTIAISVCAMWIIISTLGLNVPASDVTTDSQRSLTGAKSKAVAMLSRAVNSQWNQSGEIPQLGAAVEPGLLSLEKGLAEIVFYSGARVAIEGPAELQVTTPFEVSCTRGRLAAEIPEQASGFAIYTPHGKIKPGNAEFGLKVTPSETELHVFKGKAQLQPATGDDYRELQDSMGAVCQKSQPVRMTAVDISKFPSILKMQEQATVAETSRYDVWRSSNKTLHLDQSLLVHYDFERHGGCTWRVGNASPFKVDAAHATIVGCHRTDGRWPEKKAVEFLSQNDRVRLSVPGDYSALTLATWVQIQGLDRKLNSLFMCDGFQPGTLHWLIRNDGVLGLTLLGDGPGKFQIVASPTVITMDQIGQWIHLAVVVDGTTKRVGHYLNGIKVSQHSLTMDGPYRIGVAELGNWNSLDFPGKDSSLIRNFSGAMDEFCIFSRALSEQELHSLFLNGSPHLTTDLGVPTQRRENEQ